MSAGDYLVAEPETLRRNVDAGPYEVKVHRVKEMFPRGTPPEFPIAAIWKERLERHGADAWTLPAPADAGPALVSDAQPSADSNSFG